MIKAIFLAALVVMLPVCFADSLSYDANGNLVTGDGKYREYNSLNQLISVYNGSDSSGFLLEEFIYHPTEERVLVKKDHVNNETTYYFSKSFVRVVNSSGSFNQTFVYHNGQLVAQDIDGERLYVHTDYLGSSSVVTDLVGDVIENTRYGPYGEFVYGGDLTRYDYTEQEYDSVTGDYDYHARRYNPEWGVFLQGDKHIQNIYYPVDLNHYVYARNNPYKYNDPDGKDAWLVLDRSLAGENGHVALIIGSGNNYRWYSFGAAGGRNAYNDRSISENVQGGVAISESYDSYQLAKLNMQGDFSDSIQFETTPEEDEIMHEFAEEIQLEFASGEKTYNVFVENCADFTTDVLHSGNIKTNTITPKPNSYFDKNVERYGRYSSGDQRKSSWEKIREKSRIVYNTIKSRIAGMKSSE